MVELDRVSVVVNYFKDEQYVKRVAAEGLRAWNAKGNKAKKIGSNADEYIRAEINGESLPKLKSEEAKTAIRAWDSFKRDYPQLKFCTLPRMESEQLGVTGELDLLEKDEAMIVDVKVAYKIQPSYWIQQGGYTLTIGEKVKKVGILRLDKYLGEYEYKTTERIKEMQQLFISNLNMMRFWRGDYEHDYFSTS